MINDGKGSFFMKKFDFTRILALVMAVLLSVSLVACDEETPKTDGKTRAIWKICSKKSMRTVLTARC